MITPQEKLLLQEKLELILPDWSITNQLEASTREANNLITPLQMNQITKLGLFVSGIYSGISSLTVSFSELNR